MDTVTLIERAKGLGLILAIDGTKLNVTGPRTPATAALVAQMAQHKPAVIAYLTKSDPAPLPPMRIVTSKPPLPAELWLNGLTPAAAMAAHSRLKAEHFCSCGADATGWFVRCEESKYRLMIA